jgi:hypothetical protein
MHVQFMHYGFGVFALPIVDQYLVGGLRNFIIHLIAEVITDLN